MTWSGEGNGETRFGRSLYLGFALLRAPGFPGSSCLAPRPPTNYSVDWSANSIGIGGDVMGEGAAGSPGSGGASPYLRRSFLGLRASDTPTPLTRPLRHADAKFLQTTVKGASAEPKVFGGEHGISVMPGKRTVDQEKFGRFEIQLFELRRFDRGPADA
jgi:hypothetical protein